MKFEHPQVYAVKHKSDQERMASQSGGLFAILSDEILERGGVVYGCVFDENFRAVHARAENALQRDRMRFSKYVQSSMGNVYKDVLKDLEDGRTVLFSGTSCQIAGILRYLEMFPTKINGGFYSVDIVCHGVPSPRVWRDYLSWEKDKKKAEISDIICRNKADFGWKSHVTTLRFANGKRNDNRVYARIYSSHVDMRPGCFKCPYKSIMHPSDITIGDYWGIDSALPGFKDDRGVSLALINTDRGEELFEKCHDRMIWHLTRIEDSLQQPLIAPYDSPVNREQFWQDYEKLTFGEIARKYGRYSVIDNFRWKSRSFLKREVYLRIMSFLKGR